MTDALPESNHFSFTRLGPGEALAKNGYSFSDLDIIKLDNILQALVDHRHSGEAALGDPSSPPDLVANATGGHLPAATTYYYRIAYVDAHGLESSASPEATVTTPDPLSPPTAPAGTVLTTGGTLTAGTYSYLITFLDGYGGETTPSAINNVQITNNLGTNRIRLDLPDLSSGATGFNLYRSRPGQSAFYQIGTSAVTPFYDAGIVEDQTVQAPTVNTTNTFNSVDVTLPGAFIPLNCTSWKMYRATSSGGYDGTSLVHHVIEGASPTSIIPVTVWTDTGDALQTGVPLETSSTMSGGVVLTLDTVQGTLPLSVIPRGAQVLNAFCPGTVADSTLVTVTETPAGVSPVRFTAYFRTPPTTGGVTVSFKVSDSSTNHIQLDCSPATHQSGDDAGYFHVEYPLVAAESFEAENGVLSGTGAVIADDLSASNGQCVVLSNNADLVQVVLGTLDAGSYNTFVTVQVSNYAGSSTNDLVIEAIRDDSNTVIGTQSYTLSNTAETAYIERSGPTFTAPGGVAVTLRVKKATSTAQTYNVDKMRFATSVSSLDSGLLRIESFVSGGATTSADVNLALWF